MKRMIIAGGTGFLGSVLSRYFRDTWEVVILTRGETGFRNGVLHVHWNGKGRGDWVRYIDQSEVVINLTGKSVDCRYTDENKELIYSSRIDSTRILGEVILSVEHPPALWINAASATIYRHAEDLEMDEYHGEYGSGFSVDVCRQWEATFNHAEVGPTRKVAIRTGIVLGREGGPYIPLSRMTRFGLGGKQGSGRQYVSWLHEDDFAGIIEFLIRNQSCSGTYNVTAPVPVPNDEFMRSLRKAIGMPFGLPAPAWLLEVGARLIGTETELILKSRRVVPKRLQNEGYVFRFPEVKEAMNELQRKNSFAASASKSAPAQTFLEL